MAHRYRFASIIAGLALLLGVAAPAQALPTPSPLPTPVTMAALGDSITIAYDATALLQAQPQYSWATGSSSTVNSVGMRLEARSSTTTLTSANYAVKGAKMADLATQSGKVAVGTDLVTVLMGANDACTSSVSTMTPVATFRSQADAALAALSTRGVDQIVVASIPSIYRLWELEHTNASARFIWGLYKICQSMLANPGSTSTTDAARRQQVQQRVDAFNAELQQSCAALSQTSTTTACRFDGNAVANFQFAAADISTVDYFHPSPSGQGKLAGVVYQAAGY